MVSFVEERQCIPQRSKSISKRRKYPTPFRRSWLFCFVLFCNCSLVFKGKGVSIYNVWNACAFSQ